MEKFNIVLTNPNLVSEALEILNQDCNVYFSTGTDEDSIINCINENNAQAIFVRVEKITRRIIESCSSLKVIQEHGIGCENIDIEAASEQGVMVLNIPGATAIAVSEHAVAMMFALTGNILNLDKQLREEAISSAAVKSCKAQASFEGRNLFLIGVGHIGRRVTRKMLGMGMNVRAYDKYMSAENMKEAGAEKVETIAEGLSWADIVSLHLPLTKETENMISKRELNMMKKSSYIINVSRGGLINERDLYDAIKDKRIAGAGIDVFVTEPPVPSDPLFTLDNIVASPHSAGASMEGRTRPGILGAKSIISALRGGDVRANLVNRSLLPKLNSAVVG